MHSWRQVSHFPVEWHELRPVRLIPKTLSDWICDTIFHSHRPSHRILCLSVQLPDNMSIAYSHAIALYIPNTRSGQQCSLFARLVQWQITMSSLTFSIMLWLLWFDTLTEFEVAVVEADTTICLILCAHASACLLLMICSWKLLLCTISFGRSRCQLHELMGAVQPF